MQNDFFTKISKEIEYIHVRPENTGEQINDLIAFLYGIKSLAEYQFNDNMKTVKSENDYEAIQDIYLSTKNIADNFLLTAPILIYRIVETQLKDYLLILYKKQLSKNYYNQTKTFKEVIMEADKRTLHKLYKSSKAKINLNKIEGSSLIEELRLLNNALKHNKDRVSKALHKHNSYWISNEIIISSNIQSRIIDFNFVISSFFYELVEKIRPFFP